jgi:hypothetical protein
MIVCLTCQLFATSDIHYLQKLKRDLPITIYSTLLTSYQLCPTPNHLLNDQRQVEMLDLLPTLIWPI